MWQKGFDVCAVTGLTSCFVFVGRPVRVSLFTPSLFPRKRWCGSGREPRRLLSVAVSSGYLMAPAIGDIYRRAYSTGHMHRILLATPVLNHLY